MPNLQNLVLTDRATTPVNHTFTPGDSGNGVGVVVETTGVPTGESRFSISNRRVGEKIKGKAVLTIPVVQNETVNGISRPVVVRTAIISMDVTFAKDSTEQERNDAIGMFASSLQTTKVLVHDTFVKAQGVFTS